MLKFLLAAWLVAFLLKLSGFCFTQFGWNSNRDLIEAAFQHEMQGGWLNTPAIGDVSAYLAEYPRCCSVGGSRLIETSILNAIFLRRFYAVTIKYPVTDPTENQGEPFYEAILIMDCCGEDVPERYGMGSSVPVPTGHPSERPPRTKGPAY
ncbi:MAG: hypothetical protein Q8Q62_15170 [Mesorhizobium sp.]|nr:hypothetical protein [Mesorhizobium sp.]